jgi:hypothetical protein
MIGSDTSKDMKRKKIKGYEQPISYRTNPPISVGEGVESNRKIETESRSVIRVEHRRKKS